MKLSFKALALHLHMQGDVDKAVGAGKEGKNSSYCVP